MNDTQELANTTHTPLDLAVWRYSVRQLRSFLATHAYSGYKQDLDQLGLSPDEFPDFTKLNARLISAGWTLAPTQHNLSSTEFFDFLRRNIFPVSTHLRSVDELLFTATPDLLYGVLGYAPLLMQKEFSDFLRLFAEVAQKAICSKQDVEQPDWFVGLRNHPLDDISEAGLLNRFKWWTAEYGLVGSVKKARIYGAGLLSSVGESKMAMSDQIKKLPLNLNCVEYVHDVTKPQPQFFVAESFAHLSSILQDLGSMFSFKRGGLIGLDRARRAETVSTVELNSGLQVSGVLTRFVKDEQKQEDACYFQTTGPTQLSVSGSELAGHNKAYHQHGYSTPIGELADGTRLSSLTVGAFSARGHKVGDRASLSFASGIEVAGILKTVLPSSSGHLLVLSFDDCHVRRGSEVLFQPDWGTFDMAIGEKVTSVFGGPADTKAYNTETDQSLTPKNHVELPIESKRLDVYAQVYEFRRRHFGQVVEPRKKEANDLREIIAFLQSVILHVPRSYPQEWLALVELYEIAHLVKNPTPELKKISDEIHFQLNSLKNRYPHLQAPIDEGTRLAGHA